MSTGRSLIRSRAAVVLALALVASGSVAVPVSASAVDTFGVGVPPGDPVADSVEAGGLSVESDESVESGEPGTIRYIVTGSETSGDFGALAAEPGDAVAAVGATVVAIVPDAAAVVVNLDSVQHEQLLRFAGLSVIPDTRVFTADSEFEATGGPTANWGLDRLDQIDAALDGSFSARSQGAGVDIFVVDTGVDGTHDELAGRVGEGLDLVGDGHGTADCHGHGTHIASLAAGSTVGSARAAVVRSLRVLDCGGSGWASDVVRAIDWARGVAGGPAVINLSLGGGPSKFLDDAVARATADGLVVVVAAGNSGGDACSTSPGRAPSALTVGATTSEDSVAGFSDVGPCIDLFAPGVNIMGAVAGSSDRYKRASGTSTSAPLVSGLAALILGVDPIRQGQDAADLLRSAALTDVLKGLSPSTPNRLAQVPVDLIDSESFVPRLEATAWASFGDGSAWASFGDGSVWAVLTFEGQPLATATVAIDAGVHGVTNSEVRIGPDGHGIVVWTGSPEHLDVVVHGGRGSIGAAIDTRTRRLTPAVSIGGVVQLVDGRVAVRLDVSMTADASAAKVTTRDGSGPTTVLTDESGHAWLGVRSVDAVVVDDVEWLPVDPDS